MSFLLLGFVIERSLYLGRVDLGRFDDAGELNIALTRSELGNQRKIEQMHDIVIGLFVNRYEFSLAV